MSRTLPFKLLLSALLLLPAIGLEAQKPDPVAWETSVESMGEDVYLLRIEARIEAPWHIYDMGPYEGGPNPTTISFESNPDAELIGGHRGTRASPPGPRRAVRHGNRDLCLESRVHPTGTAQKGRATLR